MDTQASEVVIKAYRPAPSVEYTYELIDEPKGTMTHMAVSPMVLLLVTLFTPQPLQFLAPLVFLANACFMGSYNIKMQSVIALLGPVLVFSMAQIAHRLTENGVVPINATSAAPYIYFLTNAGFFIVVYKLLLLQRPTFALIKNMREQRANT